jgi:hypothetical protein
LFSDGGLGTVLSAPVNLWSIEVGRDWHAAHHASPNAWAGLSQPVGFRDDGVLLFCAHRFGPVLRNWNDVETASRQRTIGFPLLAQRQPGSERPGSGKQPICRILADDTVRKLGDDCAATASVAGRASSGRAVRVPPQLDRF